MNPDAKDMFFPKGTQFSIEPGVGRLASARAASSMLSNKNKLALAMMAGGGAAVAGGVKTMMYGKMKERHAERKIAQMRKKRAQGVAKADSVSAFGVDHGADVSKAFREPKSKEMELLIPNGARGFHPVIRGELRGYRVERKNRRKFATQTGLLGAGVGVVPGMMVGNPYAMLAGAGVGAAAGGALGYAGSKWGREFVPTTPKKPKKSKTANAT